MQHILKQFSRILLIIGGIAIISTLVIPIASPLHNVAVLMFLICTIMSVNINVIFIKKDDSTSKSFEDRVKKKLGLYGIVKTHKKKLPKHIGGFVMPALPVFSVINKKWKKRTKEAIIHENVHLEYLIKKGGLLFFFFVTAVVGTCSEALVGWSITYWLTIPLCIVGLLIFFEYITFLRTNKLAKKFRVKSRKWNKKYAYLYFIYYSIMVMILHSLITFIRWVVGIIT